MESKQTISPLMFSNIKPPKKNKEIRLIAEDKDQYLYFNPEGELNTYVSKTEIEIIPNNKAREVLYITGPSGSGKSYYASKYVEKFCEIFDKSKVLLFSRKTSDPAFDENKRIQRIPIDDELCNANIDILSVCKENTLLIFDDIDSLDKKYWECVAKLMYDILEVGRSYKLYCVITSHLINSNNKKFSRIILNESHWVVFFPKTNIRGNKYFLENYIGLEKEAIKELLNIPTRAIAVYRNFPNFYISKHQIAPLISDVHKNSKIKKEPIEDDKPTDASLVS
jgi:hypothetical protein